MKKEKIAFLLLSAVVVVILLKFYPAGRLSVPDRYSAVVPSSCVTRAFSSTNPSLLGPGRVQEGSRKVPGSFPPYNPSINRTLRSDTPRHTNNIVDFLPCGQRNDTKKRVTGCPACPHLLPETHTDSTSYLLPPTAILDRPCRGVKKTNERKRNKPQKNKTRQNKTKHEQRVVRKRHKNNQTALFLSHPLFLCLPNHTLQNCRTAP